MQGQLGDANAGNSLVPKYIGTGFTAIAAGGWHTVALKSDGSLWTWGENLNGRLGDGTTENSYVPRLIGTGFAKIAAGRYHSVALKADGSLWAWGYNGQGELGDGTTVESHVPKLIGTGYAAVAAGGNHTVALKSDGSLWAWGYNIHGQLSDGTTTNSHIPEQIGTGYTEIAAGLEHTVALKADGSLWAWGCNEEGQLGDGTTTDSHLPKLIGPGLTEIEYPDTIAPAVPAGLSATPSGAAQVDLVWAATTDNVGVKGYNVFRDGMLVARLGDVTNYRDTALAAATEYRYTVSAWDAAGNSSAQSPAVVVTTLPMPDTEAPTTPTGLTATAVGGSQINLAWTASTDNVGVTSYKVYRGGILVATLGNQASYIDTALNAATNYSYQVAACDAAGNCSARSAPATATTLPSGASHTSSTADTLFNWIEANYPAMFAPPGSKSMSFGPYFLRHYSGTNAYLVISSTTEHLYYVGPLSANTLQDLGAVQTWYANAGCAR